MVPGEHLGVAVTELLQQPRRPLDIREEERDSAGGKLVPHDPIVRSHLADDQPAKTLSSRSSGLYGSGVASARASAPSATGAGSLASGRAAPVPGADRLRLGGGAGDGGHAGHPVARPTPGKGVGASAVRTPRSGPAAARAPLS